MKLSRRPRLLHRPAARIFAAAALLWGAITGPGGPASLSSPVRAARAVGAESANPDLMLMTALPLIWGEGGAFDPASRPQLSYKQLQREFRVRPLDVLDEAGLASGRLLLLAQPRVLAPVELVALDAWVRGGGRALILTDPLLLWPSALPIGDVRRPPAIGLLGPLLAHWGLALDPPAEARPRPIAQLAR